MNAIQLRRETLEVSISPDAITARDALVAQSSAVVAVADEKGEAAAFLVLASLAKLSREVESTRKEIKAPLINTGRVIDGAASEFCAPVEKETNRIKGLLAAFDAARRARIAEEERKRAAEAARIEAERIRAERELERQRIAACVAAEAARKAADAEANATSAKARAAAMLAADIAQERADKAAAEQAEAAKVTAQLEASRIEAANRQAIQSAKPKGMGSRMVWRFEVTDIRALYAVRPDLVNVEPRSRDIERVVATGANLPGVRAWQQPEISARIGGAQ